MANHLSRRDLSSALGALTPAAPNPGASGGRSSQNSGLFDLGALYADELERAIQRARGARRAPPPLRVTDLLHPLAASPVGTARVWDIGVDDASVEMVALPPRGARAGAWFGVAVTWMATTTLGFLVATAVPAHVHRTAAAAIAISAPAVVATPPPPASVPATAPVAPIVQPQAASTTGPKVISLEDLPVAGPASTTKVAHPHHSSGIAAVPAAVAVAQVRPTVADAPPPPAKAAPPKQTGPMSLDDMIRHAVAAEQKQKH